MTDNEGGELKPCPFCGLKPKIIDTNQTLFHDPQYDGGDYRCCGDYFQVKYGDWQNAYCWKEFDKLRAEKDRLNEVLIEKYIITAQYSGASAYGREDALRDISEDLQGAGEGE